MPSLLLRIWSGAIRKIAGVEDDFVRDCTGSNPSSGTFRRQGSGQ